jgi:hypothetical protein
MAQQIIVSSQTNKISPLLFPPNNFILSWFSFQEKEEKVQASIIQKAKNFFIELSGAIPRQTLIRKLLLLLFTQGINEISLRKIKRSTESELLKMIGTNLDLIKSLITEEIKNKWIILCFEKLSLAKRPKKTDSQVLAFIHHYFTKN